MESINVCKECVHSKRKWWWPELRCTKHVDLVTGKPNSCVIMRLCGQACGEEGKDFEAKSCK
jgi:hypothetical protein